MGDRPWAKGVSQDQQRAAIALFEAGNGLLKESIFLKAVENYRKALALWDHPGIHYNLALALLNSTSPSRSTSTWFRPWPAPSRWRTRSSSTPSTTDARREKHLPGGALLYWPVPW
jgi:hypothetical protein